MIWYKYWLESRWNLIALLMIYIIYMSAIIVWGGLYDPSDWLGTLNDPEGAYSHLSILEKSRLQTFSGYLWAQFMYTVGGRVVWIFWMALGVVMGAQFLLMLSASTPDCSARTDLRSRHRVRG